MGRYDRLYDPITNAERLALIAHIEIGDVRTAPGHRDLRQPASIRPIADCIHEGPLDEILREKVLLGIFASGSRESGGVALVSVECLDGNHRLLAGLESGCWSVVGNLPPGAVDTRVNGWPAEGGDSERRWIPQEVAERSALDPADCHPVDHPEAKGATVSIPGEISSLDPRFAAEDRGIPFSELLLEWRRDHDSR